MNFHTDLEKHINKLPKDLQGFCQKNLDLLEKTEIPTKKNEFWKYSNLSKKINLESQLSNNIDYNVDNLVDDFYTVNLNHKANFAIDFSEITKQGINCIKVDSLKSVEHLLDNDPIFNNDYISLLNNCYLGNAYHIVIPKNTSFDRPLLFKHHFNGENVHHIIQLFFTIEKGAKVELLEVFSGIGRNNFINYKSHIEVKDDAFFEHDILQNLPEDYQCALSINSHVKKDASYNNCTLTKGSSFSRSNFYTNLEENGAHTSMHGLYLLDTDQHHDTMSFIGHSAPHTTSHQLYKGILNHNSRGIFTGRVRVEKDAQQIDATQLNKNLLLSAKAQANSRPQMEIYADDVKCAHGSTTGQISQDELFYFESRGIKPDRAKKMLAYAYANDVFLKVKNLKIRNYIQESIGELEF